MENFLDDLLAGGLQVVSNKRVTTGIEPMINTTPSDGGFSLNASGGLALGVGGGDHIAMATLSPRMSAKLIASIPPTVVLETGPVHMMVYRGAKSEDVAVGSKLGPVGTTLQCSSVNPWATLGGNNETLKHYALGQALNGLASLNGELIPVTADTDEDLVVDGVIVLSGSLDESKQLAQVATIAEAKKAQTFFILQFSSEREKLKRGEGETAAEAKAPKAGKAAKTPVDLDDFAS